jgi:hypothetical protein
VITRVLDANDKSVDQARCPRFGQCVPVPVNMAAVNVVVLVNVVGLVSVAVR